MVHGDGGGWEWVRGFMDSYKIGQPYTGIKTQIPTRIFAVCYSRQYISSIERIYEPLVLQPLRANAVSSCGFLNYYHRELDCKLVNTIKTSALVYVAVIAL